MNCSREKAMLSTNGHGPKRAILYARVSTDEQARTGYSLAQQLEALRDYASREGYEVLEEVSDPGQSGASLERPGMDRVRDLVAAGGVSVVLAQDRDRFAREPAYHYLLRREFEERGTTLRALNDRGDDTPEGELTDGILDQLAKFERAKTAERTRRGRLKKVKQGKIVAASPRATYGFRYNAARDGYLVEEESMRVVRRIFGMVGEEAMPIRAVARTLEREMVSTPNGGRYWRTQTIRDIVFDDCYRPHAFGEVANMVSPEVAARLDPGKSYGISWYNRRRVTTRQVAEDGPDGRRYRKVQKTVQKPRSEWVAVPVPDSGVPRELVDLARDRIKDNISPAKTTDRFWELSGGIIYCGSCGKRLFNQRLRKSSGGYHHYYRCRTRGRYGPESCLLRGMRRADEVEALVWEFVSDMMKNPEQLREDLERVVEQERRTMRGDPEREANAWLDKLAEVDRKRSGFQDMAAEGLITLDELRTKLAGLEETRKTAERELEILKGRREQLEALERDTEAVLETYARMAPEALESLSPEERHQFYKMLRLRVVVQPDGSTQVSGAFADGQDVCTLETTSPCCGRLTRSDGPGFAKILTGPKTDESGQCFSASKSRPKTALELTGARDSSKGVR
jgi:site-specific DNA recombinase